MTDELRSQSKSRGRNMRLAPFIRSLRQAGWALRYDTAAGGGRTVEFHKFFGRRDIRVQLNNTGPHTASHMRYFDTARTRGIENTSPTPFETGPGMWIAVEHERTRKDHPPTTGTARRILNG